MIKDILIDGNVTGYKISDDGYVIGKYGHRMKNRYGPNGYIQVCMRYKSHYIYKYLHRLVYEAFSGSIPPRMEINHIDGNKLNNSIDNLEITTREKNVHHSWEYGLAYKHNPHESHNIEKHLENRFPKEVIERICKELEKPDFTFYEIGKKFGCPPSMIANISNGKLWSEISSKYDISGRYKRRKEMYLKRDILIAKFRKKGLTIQEIADEMKMSFDAVARRLYLMRHKRKGSTTIPKGSTLK